MNLLKFLRVALLVLVAFAVLTHGAVEDWARAILEISAALLFLVWAVHTLLRREEQIVVSPLIPPLFLFLVVAIFQLLSHRTASLYDTHAETLLLLAYILILFVAAQAFRTLDDWKQFVWATMLFGFLVSLFGILQHLTFNGKLYWFREMRYGGIPFGPYVNRNHFAGFAELIIPIALVPLALGKVRRERLFIVAVLAVVPIVALLMSASRGGIVSLGVELALLAIWILWRKPDRKQLFTGGAVLLVALLVVSWLGVQQVLRRFTSMQSLEVTEGKRASMRYGTWKIFLDHPVTGTGLGTLQTVFPPYETLYDAKVVNHSHNDYLEALAETGILGGLCCFWFLSALFVDSLRRIASEPQSFNSILHLSGLLGCCGLLAHSMVDFNLHIPSNAILFFLMAYLATCDVQQPLAESPSRRRRRHRRRKTSTT